MVLHGIIKINEYKSYLEAVEGFLYMVACIFVVVVEGFLYMVATILGLHVFLWCDLR